MERIQPSELNELVKQPSASSGTVKSSPKRLETSTQILSWMDVAAQEAKEELPTKERARLWVETLSSFPRGAIDWAFRDYLANGLDDEKRFWFPKLAQIVDRCKEWTEMQEGKPATWKRPACDECHSIGLVPKKMIEKGKVVERYVRCEACNPKPVQEQKQ